MRESSISYISAKGTAHKKLEACIGVLSSTVNNWPNFGRSIPAEYFKPITDGLEVSSKNLPTAEDGGIVSDDDSKWLSMILQLPDDAKQVMKYQIRGYWNIVKH